jgi:hypothetical protein
VMNAAMIVVTNAVVTMTVMLTLLVTDMVLLHATLTPAVLMNLVVGKIGTPEGRSIFASVRQMPFRLSRVAHDSKLLKLFLCVFPDILPFSFPPCL